jgi:hypothetical protein
MAEGMKLLNKIDGERHHRVVLQDDVMDFCRSQGSTGEGRRPNFLNNPLCAQSENSRNSKAGIQL